MGRVPELTSATHGGEQTYKWANLLQADYARRYQVPADFTVYKEDSTYYAEACSPGLSDDDNTDLGTLLKNCVDVLDAGHIWLKLQEDWTLDSDVLIDHGGLHFWGMGWTNKLKINANSGFSFADSSIIQDTGFHSMGFDGQSGTADYCIRSTGMTDGIRLTDVEIDHCYFNEFIKAATTAVHLHNIENSWITNNYFSRTRLALLKLTANDYDAGNVRIKNNFFKVPVDNHTSAAIHVEPLDNDGSNGSVVGIYLDGNHYFSANVFRGTALSLVATSGNGTISLLYGNKERAEYVSYILTNGQTAADFNGGHFGECFFFSSIANQVLVNLDQYCQNFHFDDVTFQETGAGGGAVTDACTSNQQYNRFTDCSFLNGAMAPSTKTYFHNCKWDISPHPVTVRTSGVNNWRAGNFMVAYNATANTIVTATDYTARNSRWFVSVTGGTKTATIVKDPSGNQAVDYGAADCSFFLDHLWKFQVVFTVAPTVTVTPLL